MNRTELTGTLERIGFSPYQAETYVTLLELGSASAREIADTSGVPNPRIYDVLRDLEDRGYIITYEQDQLYAGIPDLADSLAGIRSQVDQYETAIEAIKARWTEPETDEHEITLVRRFDTVFEQTRQDIENADHYVQISLTPDEFRTLQPTLREAFDRSVHIFTLIQTPAEGSFPLSSTDFEGVCTEARRTSPCRMKPFAALIDHRKVGFALNRGTSNEYGLHVDDPIHEYIFWFYLTGLWEVGTPLYAVEELQLPMVFSEIRGSIQVIEPLLASDSEVRVRVEGSWTRTGRSCEFSGSVRSVDYGEEPTTERSASVLELADQAALIVETNDDVYSVGGYGAVLEDATASRITIRGIEDGTDSA